MAVTFSRGSWGRRKRRRTAVLICKSIWEPGTTLVQFDLGPYRGIAGDAVVTVQVDGLQVAFRGVPYFTFSLCVRLLKGTRVILNCRGIPPPSWRSASNRLARIDSVLVLVDGVVPSHGLGSRTLKLKP